MKFRVSDEHGTVIEMELYEGRVRMITDADRLPQSHPVWLDRTQVTQVMLALGELRAELYEEPPESS